MMAPETVVNVEPNKPSHGQQPQQQQGALDWIKINTDYFKTLPGIVKIVELVLGILCMALASPAWGSGTGWFQFVAIISFIMTLIWSFMYLLGVREALRLPINWPMTELWNTAVHTLFYFIAFIVQFASSGYYGSLYVYGRYVAAAVFGMFNTVAYGFGTYLLYKENRLPASSVGVTA